MNPMELIISSHPLKYSMTIPSTVGMPPVLFIIGERNHILDEIYAPMTNRVIYIRTVARWH